MNKKHKEPNKEKISKTQEREMNQERKPNPKNSQQKPGTCRKH